MTGQIFCSCKICTSAIHGGRMPEGRLFLFPNMIEEEYKRVLVWSGWLRTSHWSTALSVLVLLATGWLISNAPSVAESALDIHYYAASFLLFGLSVRVILFITGKAHERFAGLIPDSSDIRNMGKMLRFYLSFGRLPLPRWYAHNPFWKPVYLFLYLALLIQVLSGALMHEIPLVWRFYMPTVHEYWSFIIFWICISHIAAVVLHEVRGTGTDISAILHGYRLFVVERNQNMSDQKMAVNFVSLDDLKKKEKQLGD
ncbi:MAG: cytochrome b/b6 domain-containing protein [Gammaproteobacteria bacterium]|nr:MAG: cytochrome b/b6 domain-containing protein [Gammaproteobacteria bacterium]